jgi:putative aldouronate transport system permease protein
MHKQFPLHLMLIPPVMIVLVYCYLPMLGLVMAFQKFVPSLGFAGSAWVGLENFRYLFSTSGFSRALNNTLFIALMKIAVGMIVPVIFTLLLNEINRNNIKKAIQTLVYLPYFISWVLMAGIIIDLLSPGHGIINHLLGKLGIDSIFFLADNRWFPFIIVITNTWKEFGWGTIIFLAALTGVDPTLYEAAMVDGAGRFRQTIHITLPGIMTTFVLVATLSLGNILNAGFDQIFNLLSPITYESGDIIDTLVYRIAFDNAQFSVATAAGLFKSLVSMVMISLSYYLAKRFAGYRIF